LLKKKKKRRYIEYPNKELLYILNYNNMDADGPSGRDPIDISI
jgi:hypothetical protein